MITSPNLTLSELKQMFLEILLNKTDKVSDIGDDSVLNGVAFGVAKIAQKAIKDIAITETKIFPQTAKGEFLDESAKLFGVSPRRGANGSSTYIKIIADIGTHYITGTHYFISNNGIRFTLEKDYIVDSQNWGYIKVKSIDLGVKMNVVPNSIMTVSPIPTGHLAVTNEYAATGGIDEESDEVFRIRILNNFNLLSKGTLAYYNAVFQQLDNRILRVLLGQTDELNKKELLIVTQNGEDLTEQELQILTEKSLPYFSISDISPFGENNSFVLKNVNWFTIYIDFRVKLEPDYNVEDVRIEIQSNLTKVLDFRFWELNQKVEWDDLLQVVKNTNGVKYVLDEYFYPNSDLYVAYNLLPRISGFIMRDEDGNVLFNQIKLIPIFYPND